MITVVVNNVFTEVRQVILFIHSFIKLFCFGKVPKLMLIKIVLVEDNSNNLEKFDFK